MTSFLFWNLNRKRLELVLRRLAGLHDLDVLALAECEVPESVMVRSLNAVSRGTFRRIPTVASERIQVYSRLPPSCFGPVLAEADHYLIRTLTPVNGIEIVLALAHMASPLHKRVGDRSSRCVGFAHAIRDAEKAKGHDRTLVMGDLNMNPFDPGMLDVRGLAALGDRHTVQRKSPRRFGKMYVEEFPLFYNPMWSHFGDAVQPAGTYYYDQSNPEVDPLWNIFDQVLLRPSLLLRFQSKNLKIVSTDGQVSLVVKDGRPNSDVFSDHLPIWFRLDLRRRVRHARS